MILIAKQFGGAAFGGYVRDVVINRQLGKQREAFKDVDLWFKSVKDAMDFVTSMDSERPHLPLWRIMVQHAITTPNWIAVLIENNMV